MKSDLDFTTYQSPFSWRYGSDQMREIFSEINKRKIWRKVWVALARAQDKAGLLTHDEFLAISKNAQKIDIKKAQQIEKEIYHDLMAEIKVYAAQSGKAGGKIHLGATSMDIEDNADILRFTQALEIVENKIISLIKSWSFKVKKYKSTVCMAYTHLQPAEPTTLGYRFAIYAQDLLFDLNLLRYFKNNLVAKGMKGAVGTSASFVLLLKGKSISAKGLSQLVTDELNLKESTVSTQTYPRKMDLHLLYVLASIAQSLHKFAFDLRIMSSPNFGEWAEARSEKRVGSSAMPFKRNPDRAEKVCSLARYIASLVNVAWSNAAESLLERTLDDSANRRVYIPEAFLTVDEILTTTEDLVAGLVILENNIKKNLDRFGLFAGTESLMIKAVENGADRQEIHERIRQISMEAWGELDQTNINPLVNLLQKDKIIAKFVAREDIPHLLEPSFHIGLAQEKCVVLLKEIKSQL